MQPGCDVCLSVCLSCFSVSDNRPGASCNLGLTGGGTTEVLFLKHRGGASTKFMKCIPAFWLSTPNLTCNLPQTPKSGQIQEITPQPYLPLRQGLQQMFY